MLLRLSVLRRGVTRGNHVGQPQWLGGTNSAVNTVLKALSSVGGIRHQRSFLHTSSTSLAASGHKDIYGVPFEVMPNQVDSLFRHWCEQKTPFLRIPEYQYYAYYVPFWSYDIGAEFTDGSRQQYHHDSQSMVYGGYTFRRSMVEVLKSGRHQRQQLFNNNLLNIGVSVNIDVWTVYDNLAWDVACGTIEQSAGRQLRDAIEYEVEKVMIPAYVVEYKHLGEVWRVFINGVTGESFGFEQKGILATIYRTVVTNLPYILPFGRVFVRLLFLPPVAIAAAIGLFSHAFVQQRAAVRLQRESWLEWERIKQQEMNRKAWQTVYPRTSRASASSSHQKQQARTSSSRQRESGPSKAQTRTSAAADSGNYIKVPPLRDPSDYYEVLGLENMRQGASIADIKRAFHKEVFKYHSDTNNAALKQGQPGFRPEEAAERARLIIQAYQVLRDPNKRREFDALRGRR